MSVSVHKSVCELFYISNFFLSHCAANTQTHLATDGTNMFDRGTLLFLAWVF